MEISQSDLNDELLNLPIFKCQYCKKLLKYPVFQVPEVGNCCGSCLKYTRYVDEERNTELESILCKLKVPCKYKKNGCNEKIYFIDLSKHEGSCAFHDLICPFMFFNECAQGESFVNIVDHFEEHHASSLIITEYHSVKLCFRINCNYDQINLLVIKNEKFLVRIKLDHDDKQLFYIIYYIGEVDKIDNFLCTIEQQCENMRIENKGTILPETEINDEFDKKRAISFNLVFLREFFEENINTCIKITTKNIESSEICEKLLYCFECPVCNTYMRPPILQCISGHTICNKCRPKLEHCPICRSIFGHTRNYVLESLSNSVRHPCVYKEYGCNKTFSITEITQHEEECNLRPYNCPLHEQTHCLWNGAYTNISSHLRVCHSDKIVCNNHSMCIVPFSCDAQQQYFEVRCMLAFGQIFRMCHQRHQNGYWSVQLIGPKGMAQKYKYEIGLLHSTNQNRTLFRTDVCRDMTDQNEMFNDCVMLPLNVLSSFASNGRLMYWYKITDDVK